MHWLGNNLPKLKLSAIPVALIFSTLFLSLHSFAQEENQFKKNWKELKADPQYSISQSLQFFRLKTEQGSLAELVVFDLNDHNFTIKPFFNEHSDTVSNVVKKQKALAGINGGFFNLSNGESTSYVVINGKDQCDPKTNKDLINNKELAPYLESIFNRSELRICLNNKDGKIKAMVAAHKDPTPEGWSLLHSLQAGPRLLPTITDKEEAFIRISSAGKEIDSIGSKKPAARTAIGITRDNHILLLSIANKKQDQFSSGATLNELAKMLQDLGCNQALNCDGGTSTSMVISEGDCRDEINYVIHKVIVGEPEKQVKSGLIIQKNKVNTQSRYNNDAFPH